MTTMAQIRGMLLEEALLYLLRVSGYRTVDNEMVSTGEDPTLRIGHSGIEVIGRGGFHQIDAIADFTIAQPFSHPQRLLVEAKCYRDRDTIGIEVARNALGVLKDVGEYWVSSTGLPAKNRYHYQYALFASSGYALPAQQYAYAHDIYLIPLANSKFIRPVITKIMSINPLHFGQPAANSIQVNMTLLRQSVRERIREPWGGQLEDRFEIRAAPFINEFCTQVRQMSGALLAMIAKQFPIFLVPSPEFPLGKLEDHYEIRIRRLNNEWFLEDTRTNQRLFSFDIPQRLFELYAEDGSLSKERAIDMKADMLSDLQAILTLQGYPRLITFYLDRNWLDSIRDQLRSDVMGVTRAGNRVNQRMNRK